MNQAMKVFGEWNKGWQAIAAEMSDYTKRSFEESTATFEKLLSAKSVEQAIEIQTGFAKRAYDDYMQQMSKIGGMYADSPRRPTSRSRRRCRTPLSATRREHRLRHERARLVPGLFCVPCASQRARPFVSQLPHRR